MLSIRISQYKPCTELTVVICCRNVDMKHRAYCCDASRDLYEEYYSRQNGGEIPVFVGRRFQRGHGLGSILSGFFRRLVLPFFKTHGKTMLSGALKTGMEMADDVLEGQPLKESAKKRVPEGIKRTVLSMSRQSGSGIKKKRIVKRRRRPRDIFE